jgi:hypothetical protein
MDEDQDFGTFLREWAKERIWPTDPSLQHFLAKARAIELIQLAVARGFRDELMETQRKYGSVQASHEPSTWFRGGRTDTP